MFFGGVCMCVCVCVCVCVCACLCMYVCMYMYVCVYMCVYVCIYVFSFFLHTCVQTVPNYVRSSYPTPTHLSNAVVTQFFPGS